MQKDDLNRLKHMRDVAREATDFARGRAKSELDTDRMLVLALMKDIEIIGEAANRFRRRHGPNSRRFRGRILSVCVIAWSTPISISTWKSFDVRSSEIFRHCSQHWRKY
jgi:hypothetical protein